MGNFYLQSIKSLLEAAKNEEELLEAVVNAPFYDPIKATKLDLGIVVLLLVNKKQVTIDRVALSDTEQAKGAVRMSEKPFKEIKIPLGHPVNIIARAIESGEAKYVSDWQYLFTPALSPRAARFNQAGAGIEFSCVYPLKARDGGALIFSFFQVSNNIQEKHYHFMTYYARLVDSFLQKDQPIKAVTSLS